MLSITLYHSFFDFPVFLSFFLLSLLFVFGLVLLCQAKGRNSALKVSGFGISWFFITLAVESTFVPLHVIFEHRLYLPSMGILFSAVTLVYVFALNTCDKNIFMYGKGLIWVTILLLSILTVSRNRVWNSDRLLWEDVVNKSPEKERGYTNLGIAYEKAGLMDKAIRQHLKAFELNPDKPEVSLNLGNDFSQKGDLKQAIFYYGNALRLLPEYPEARNNLGRALERKGELNMAIENYLAALELNPNLVGPLINIGNILLRQNKPEQAIQFYKKALKKVPDHFEGLMNSGLAQRRMNQPGKAIAAYQKLIVAYSGNPLPYYHLGKTFWALKKGDKAVETLKTAIKLAPSMARAHELLGQIYRDTV